MKILFFSDVHGSPDSLDLLTERIRHFQPELLVLLGDALYHGPRNSLRADYAPPAAVERLNTFREKIVAVRGNCDAEVDQMLLQFPMMADYSTVFADGVRFFLTHGHLWNADQLPALPSGTIFAQGHTHIPEISDAQGGILIFNPGSISLPKRNFPPSFGTFDGKNLAVRNLENGEAILERTLAAN